MPRATLFYCGQGAPGDGSLRRGVAVAEELQRDFDVTMLIDQSQKRHLPAPKGIKFIALPDATSEDGTGNQQAGSLGDRLDVLLRTFDAIRPRVVAIDSFPFHRYDLCAEFLPLLRRVRGSDYGELLVVSITDCSMSNTTPTRESRADATASVLERYFDIAVIRSDPLFAREEEFFQPRNAVHTPLFHTGFVTTNSGDLGLIRGSRSGIVVSAGDGETGTTLCRAAIEAHETIRETWPEPMTVVAGRNLPEKEWRYLLKRVQGLPSLSLKRKSPDIGVEMAAAKWAICRCDYESAVNTMRARTPSLFVPDGISRSRKEIERAKRMVYWGAGRLLMPRHLNSASLINEIHQLSTFEARPMPFDLGGSRNAARLIAQIAYHNNYTPVGVRSSLNPRLN